MSATRGALGAVLRLAGLHTAAQQVRRYARTPRALREDLGLLRDYLRYRREAAVLRQVPAAGAGAPVVLFVHLSDVVFQAKMEALLGRTFELRGFRPVVLLRDPHTRTRRYFEAAGVRDFRILDDYLAGIDAAAVAAEADAVLCARPGFAALLDFRLNGIEIGSHVLSSVVRRLRGGSIDFDDPATRRLLREILIEALQNAHAAERLLDELKPAKALFLERGYTPYGEFFDAALERGVDVVQWHHGHNSDALNVKRYTRATRRQHPYSIGRETWQRIAALPWDERAGEEIVGELKQRYEEGSWFHRKFLLEGKRMKTPEEVRRQLRLDPARPTVVVFSHVLWDATFFYGVSLFDDYEHWLIETVRAACANPAVNWVVKLHPDYLWKMKALGDTAAPRDLLALAANVGELPAHVQVMEPDTDISTFSLFQVTDVGITVRGTIGIELPCFGVPVLTAGTGRYSGLGFTIDSSSREEYLDRLARVQHLGRLGAEETALARKHAFYLFRARGCSTPSVQLTQLSFDRTAHPLAQNVSLRLRTLEELRSAPDLEALADWVLNSSDGDFLDPLVVSRFARRPQAVLEAV